MNLFFIGTNNQTGMQLQKYIFSRLRTTWRFSVNTYIYINFLKIKSKELITNGIKISRDNICELKLWKGKIEGNINIGIFISYGPFSYHEASNYLRTK